MIIGRLNPKSNQRNIIYDTFGLSPTIQAAAGMGGGQVPLIIEVTEINKQNIEVDNGSTYKTSN